jgi:hypothetical protein
VLESIFESPVQLSGFRKKKKDPKNKGLHPVGRIYRQEKSFNIEVT